MLQSKPFYNEKADKSLVLNRLMYMLSSIEGKIDASWLSNWIQEYAETTVLLTEKHLAKVQELAQEEEILNEYEEEHKNDKPEFPKIEGYNPETHGILENMLKEVIFEGIPMKENPVAQLLGIKDWKLFATSLMQSASNLSLFFNVKNKFYTKTEHKKVIILYRE